MLSLPSRERGLKSGCPYSKAVGFVAPFAGAWIEMSSLMPFPSLSFVAPFAGAWIEINIACARVTEASSRSLRGSVD